MAVDVIMPQMGESIFEGTITKWLKKPGDRIERDEPLFEISTDKVDAEIPAPSAGVLKEIKVTGRADGTDPDRRRCDRRGGGFGCRACRGSAAAPAPAPPKAEAPKAAAPAPAAPAAAPAPPAAAPAPAPAQAPFRQHAATARKFAAPRWFAASPKNTTWISAKWREAAPAGASARKIFSPPWNRAARSLRARGSRRAHSRSCRPPRRRPRRPRPSAGAGRRGGSPGA